MLTSSRTAPPVAFSLAIVACGCAPTFLERAAKERGAEWMPSGGVIRVERHSEGKIPELEEKVKVSWEGRRVDGKLFGSSRQAGGTGPLEIARATASPCWRDALAILHFGESARVVCAPDGARSDLGPKVPLDTTLDFTLELLVPGAAEAEPPLPAGLVIRTLRAGTGDHPRGTDRVKVHYEGRLADGTVFDSSIKRDEPAVLPLNGVVPCWRAAIPRMQVGEKAELTCPPELAYGKKGSPPTIPPNATLTFEVELLGIER